MHISSMPETNGSVEKDLHKSKHSCRKCKSDNVYYKIWESSCGGYEDLKYKCKNCNFTWWIDGIDS